MSFGGACLFFVRLLGRKMCCRFFVMHGLKVLFMFVLKIFRWASMLRVH